MRNPSASGLPKWPFIVGDLLLLSLSIFICANSHGPLRLGSALVAGACVALGAVLAILPFVLEYRVAARLVEADALGETVSKLGDLAKAAALVQSATTQWQDIQAHSEKAATSASQLTERITAEARGFADFMQRVDDNEKATLRLEVEKLHRAEKEWLQVLVRMLDHVYALHQGALRSGQPSLIEQLDHFQNACRDAARRVGLLAFVPATAEPFDPERHQLPNGDGKTSAGVPVDSTIATGYTFQGRLVRPALVKLRENGDG